VRKTAGSEISGAGLSGILRLTWMQDDLAHVLEHCNADEPSGTWTGLACPDHALPLGSDVDEAVLRGMCAHSDIADIIWETPDDLTAEHRRVFDAAMQAFHTGSPQRAEQLWKDVQEVWSRAWAANYAALEFLQRSGLATFAPVKPQRWVIASFEHHCGPHGMVHPHVHNVVIARLTTGPGPTGSKVLPQDGPD
jgi:hypothetical protein